MRAISLFSGCGGFDLAAEAAGIEIAAQCEIDKDCRAVLRRHWPHMTIWEDIRDVTGDRVRAECGAIDILFGGFPCQPHSVAGRREGFGDERDLWPEVVRLLREVGPRWFVGENVPGLLTSNDGRFFGGVLRDLAALGYDASWGMWGACDVGALHRRDRVFIVANLNGERVERRSEGQVLGQPNVSFRQIGEPFQDAERRFNTYQSRLCRSLHGIPGGVAGVKMLGNAVVPAQAQVLFEEIMRTEMIPNADKKLHDED